ncbi:hypothetical protein FACS1894155_05720 [Bacteroidia bacterium]|nr:hypothetical protein FACS1894155_05720 [Bacteroidia bacterium]
MKNSIYIGIIFLLLSVGLCAQNQGALVSPRTPHPYSGVGDSLSVMIIPDIYVYPPVEFKSITEEEKYRKLIRDVKRTLPYAKLIYVTLIETYEYMQTLPTEKQRQDHMKRMEKDLYAEYFPVLKKMSLSQGKLLIKLINRECNQSSYDILKAFLGSFRAGFWNIFAGIFGASLKSEWDPKGKDAMTERIVILVEEGAL